MSLIGDFFHRLRLRFSRWRSLDVRGLYTLPVPPGYRHEFTEDDQTLCITLPTDPVTEVRVARWAFQDTDAADRATALRLLLDEFVTGSIAKSIGRAVTEFRTFDRSEPWRIILQGLVPVEIEGRKRRDSRWWLVRFEVAAGGDYFYVLHWNGTYRDLRRVALVMFEGFEPRSLQHSDIE